MGFPSTFPYRHEDEQLSDSCFLEKGYLKGYNTSLLCHTVVANVNREDHASGGEGSSRRRKWGEIRREALRELIITVRRVLKRTEVLAGLFSG